MASCIAAAATATAATLSVRPNPKALLAFSPKIKQTPFSNSSFTALNKSFHSLSISSPSSISRRSLVVKAVSILILSFRYNLDKLITSIILFEFDVFVQSELPLVGNVAPDFEAEAVFDQEFINVCSTGILFYFDIFMWIEISYFTIQLNFGFW